MIYWDTSALVKAYAALEPGHARARSLLLAAHGHKASVLIRLEAVSAVVRTVADRAARNSILALLERHLRTFDLVPVDDAQLGLADSLVRRRALRAADALHLAGALFLARTLGRRALRFATSDAPQAAAARAEGLAVIEP